MPAQLPPTLRYIQDTLRDSSIIANGNVVVTTKDPNKDPDVASEAKAQGVREMQFNVVGQEQFQVKKGYLGLAISYGGNHETIPFVQGTSDLEYQLTSAVKKLTTTDKKTVAFLTGHGEKSRFSDYNSFNDDLSKQFTVNTVTISEDNNSIPKDTTVVIVAGPSQEIDGPTREAVKKYLSEGGSAFFLQDQVSVSSETLTATLNPYGFADVLGDYGIKVQKNLVYDLRSNETITFGSGLVSFLVPYPFWARLVPGQADSVITSRIENVVIPWGSSITLQDQQLADNQLEATPLLTTTEAGGLQTGSFDISPNSKPSNQNLGKQVLAVQVTRKKDSDKPPLRVVVVGNSDFLTEQFAKNSPENIVFGSQAVSWLAEEESIAGIRFKELGKHNLQFANNTQMMVVKYANMGAAFLVPLVFGFYRLYRRRQLRERVYKV